MRMRKLSPKTQSGYIRAVKQFTRFLGRLPDTATDEDLRLDQLFLVDSGMSAISLNAAITGLKFFFEVTLKRGGLMEAMQSVPVPRKLPVVLSGDEVTRLIASAGSPKYQAALSLAYGAGLRASEVIGLKVGETIAKAWCRIESCGGLRSPRDAVAGVARDCLGGAAATAAQGKMLTSALAASGQNPIDPLSTASLTGPVLPQWRRSLPQPM